MLARAGVQNPRLDAELIVAHCLETGRIGLLLKLDDELSFEQTQCIERLTMRRAAREPIQYILGSREFWSIDFRVDEGVLVPRPETETLVEASLAHLRSIAEEIEAASHKPLIIDIGTGCGAISVALAKELRSHCTVIATDISMQALRVATENVKSANVSDAVSLVCCDLIDGLSANRLRGKVQLLVSNPPYIPTETLVGLQPEVSLFEPRIALNGGPDGLAFYPRLMHIGSELLAKGGALICEIDFEMTRDILRLWLEYKSHLAEPTFQNDLAGRPRAAVFTKL